MLGLHSLPKTQGKKKWRVGRGAGSGSGKTAGRGTKGQRSRTGGRSGLKLRGLKQTMLAMPKVRGFKSFKPRAQAVNLHQLERAFNAGDAVTPELLYAKGIVASAEAPVKILGTGTLSKLLTVQARAASVSAIAAIEKAGGTFEVLAKQPRAKKTTVKGKKSRVQKTA